MTEAISNIVARVAAQHQVQHTIRADDHLVDRGLTSLAMVDLMLAIEAEFDLTIPQREMTVGNFESIASLTRLMARLRPAA